MATNKKREFFHVSIIGDNGANDSVRNFYDYITRKEPTIDNAKKDTLFEVKALANVQMGDAARDSIMVDGIIFIYDMHNRQTFINLEEWIINLRKDTMFWGKPKIIVGDRGNPSVLRQVEMKDGQQLASFCKTQYLETTAADEVNLLAAIRQLIMNKIEKTETI